MNWPFCSCGTILDASEDGSISCSVCPFKSHFMKLQIKDSITRSAPIPKANWLGDDENEGDNQTINGKYAIIEEPCPKCGHPEQYFYTMQLRSVDEGSTVFYECPKCTNKYSVNN